MLLVKQHLGKLMVGPLDVDFGNCLQMNLTALAFAGFKGGDAPTFWTF